MLNHTYKLNKLFFLNALILLVVFVLGGCFAKKIERVESNPQAVVEKKVNVKTKEIKNSEVIDTSIDKENNKVIQTFKLINNNDDDDANSLPPIIPVEFSQDISKWEIYESKNFGIRIRFPKELNVSIKEITEEVRVAGTIDEFVPATHLEFSQPSILYPNIKESTFVMMSFADKKASESLEDWFNQNIDPTKTLIAKKVVTMHKLPSGNALYNDTGKSFGETMTDEFRKRLTELGPQYWFGFIEFSPTKVLDITYAGQDNQLYEYLGNDVEIFIKNKNNLLINIMKSIKKID